ncbi:MAG TPA: tetrahydrofolate dehydrogenase/cyclohydrolase catalytic domain-containing protein [Burkholderiales bacterium]|jgi:methylenetetrahydrofolate dehydrogenase (NADP+)/methenyltetrahydrofolate cyclohydrolase|nr:tetrahydrofolate dehydrogenase/cyclohydrolase catalytic domain-containing protein [Burkholderiales bacterium]
MTAQILQGAPYAREIYAGLAQRIAALKARGVQPGLAAIEAGGNAASLVYIRNKVKACAAAGVRSEVHSLPVDCSESALLERLEALNRDPRVHGVIVQLPLPRALDPRRVLQAIAPEKDVDGFGWGNLGALLDGAPRYVPGTPLAVMTLLDRAAIPISGRHAVVVGRSTIVGKPMALLLLSRDATVTVCHSRTPDLARFTRAADIIVVAAGKPGVLTGQMIKNGAVVIDVGINRLADGRLAGDVDFPSVSAIASWITPVPGGVGPMTVAMLIANTVGAAERSLAMQ